MLFWVIVFFVISLVAAIFGFTGIAAALQALQKFYFLFFFCFLLWRYCSDSGDGPLPEGNEDTSKIKQINQAMVDFSGSHPYSSVRFSNIFVME